MAAVGTEYVADGARVAEFGGDIGQGDCADVMVKNGTDREPKLHAHIKEQVDTPQVWKGAGRGTDAMGRPTLG